MKKCPMLGSLQLTIEKSGIKNLLLVLKMVFMVLVYLLKSRNFYINSSYSKKNDKNFDATG